MLSLIGSKGLSVETTWKVALREKSKPKADEKLAPRSSKWDGNVDVDVNTMASVSECCQTTGPYKHLL